MLLALALLLGCSPDPYAQLEGKSVEVIYGMGDDTEYEAGCLTGVDRKGLTLDNGARVTVIPRDRVLSVTGSGPCE